MKGAVSDYGAAPREDPASYPGELPESSYLLLGCSVLPLRPVPGPPLGQWKIRGMGDWGAPEDLSSWRDGLGPDSSLDDRLLVAGATGMQERMPVLAVGSNASPPQLQHKLCGVGPIGEQKVAIPVVKAYVRGLEVAFSAHVSPPGYIPVALRASASSSHRTPVFVTFFDAGQLALIDGSEPNYDRVALAHPDGGPVVLLEAGDALGVCDAYRTRHGVLDLDAHERGTLLTQRRVRARVQERIAAVGAPAAETWAMLRKGGLPLRAIPEIAAAGLVAPDGLEPFLSQGLAGGGVEQVNTLDVDGDMRRRPGPGAGARVEAGRERGGGGPPQP